MASGHFSSPSNTGLIICMYNCFSAMGNLSVIPLMPTLLDYPGVSRIQNESPGLPYGSPSLPDKRKFGNSFLQKTKNQANFILYYIIYITFSCQGWLYRCEILLDFGLCSSILGTFSL